MARRERLCRPGRAVSVSSRAPPPARSAFPLGILRGNGLLGGLAAWFAFTMPSALIMFAFAIGAAAFTGPVADGFLHGLKLVAVAVIAQAIWGDVANPDPRPDARRHRARCDCDRRVCSPDRSGRSRRSCSARARAFGFAGEKPRGRRPSEFSGHAAGRCHCASLFAALLLIPPVVVQREPLARTRPVRRVLSLGRAGVWRRPCRAAAVAGASRDAGMGQQRDIPGGLWTGTGGAGAALYLRRLSRRRDGAFAKRPCGGDDRPRRAAAAGHAAGLWHVAVLGCAAHTPQCAGRDARHQRRRGRHSRAALYNPVWTSAVATPRDFALALAGFLLLTVWKLSPWIVVRAAWPARGHCLSHRSKTSAIALPRGDEAMNAPETLNDRPRRPIVGPLQESIEGLSMSLRCITPSGAAVHALAGDLYRRCARRASGPRGGALSHQTRAHHFAERGRRRRRYHGARHRGKTGRQTRAALLRRESARRRRHRRGARRRSSPPDGYTLTLLTNGTAISVSLFQKLPFDPLKDFEPISSLGFFEFHLHDQRHLAASRRSETSSPPPRQNPAA